MWPIGLSARLPIAGTVGRHPAVYLMGRDPIPRRLGFARGRMRAPGVIRYQPPFPAVVPVRGAGWSRVTHPFATLCTAEAVLTVRLACVRHAASVHPEPGSNSPFDLGLTSPPVRGVRRVSRQSEMKKVISMKHETAHWHVSICPPRDLPRRAPGVHRSIRFSRCRGHRPHAPPRRAFPRSSLVILRGAPLRVKRFPRKSRKVFPALPAPFGASRARRPVTPRSAHRRRGGGIKRKRGARRTPLQHKRFRKPMRLEQHAAGSTHLQPAI